MTTMTDSIWQTGTYNLLIADDNEGELGDLMVVVFALPVDPDDRTADEDAPILASLDVHSSEYKGPLSAHQFGLHSIGERGLIQPEDVEKVFGPTLGLRVLLALYRAADNDFQGMDNAGRPWRSPCEEGAFPLMARVHPLLMDLKNRQ